MSDEEDELPRFIFEMRDAKTVEALRTRGGHLYVTRDSAGLPVARTRPPEAAIPFDTISGGGWTVHVDPTMGPAHWAVKWSRFPWPRFRLLFPGGSLPYSGALLEDILNF